MLPEASTTEPISKIYPIASISSNPRLKKSTELDQFIMSLIRARLSSEPKVRSTSSRSLGHRTSSEAKDGTSLNDFPFIGRSFCPVEWMDVSALHIFRFRTSLSDELCLFAILSLRLSVSVCPLDGSKIGSWPSFCLEPVLFCFSTLVKFSLASGK